MNPDNDFRTVYTELAGKPDAWEALSRIRTRTNELLQLAEDIANQNLTVAPIAQPAKPVGSDWDEWGVHKHDKNQIRHGHRKAKANQTAQWMVDNIKDTDRLRFLADMIHNGQLSYLSVEAELFASLAGVNPFGSWDSWGMFGAKLAKMVEFNDLLASDAAGETDPFEGLV